MQDKSNFKRLFFDIETSPNIGLFWKTGYNLTIGHNNILKERAIICIAWKWEHENKVHAIAWDRNQSDKSMLEKFVEVLKEADEVVGHNSDRFDLKWIRARCVVNEVECPPDFVSVDTLKLARSNFHFNSNRLDYLGKFLGAGGKMNTGGFDLWKEVFIEKSQKALKKMVKYCKVDVLVLKRVYKKLEPFVKHKTHKGVFAGHGRVSCPECSSKEVTREKTRVSAAGYIKIQLRCKKCFKYFTIPKSVYDRETS